ncbi:MAG: hypothetical protein KKC18_04350, partial [Chloroflexi bacterium]|nr:hypothetical protein [Chloroflexota bacterium]
MKTKLVLLTGATLLALAVVPVGIAAAQAGGPSGPGNAQQGARIYGLLKEIEGETLTLATPIGPVPLVTDANTRFRVSGVEAPGLDDLAAGDTIAASGWWEEEGNTFHAFGVARLEADRTLPLVGKLDAVSDDTLTVETERGLATVHLDGETAYRIPHVDAPGLSNLEEGMRVIVKGTLNSDGSLLAQEVAV